MRRCPGPDSHGSKSHDVPDARIACLKQVISHRDRISMERRENVYRQALLDGADNREALQAVIGLVIAETGPEDTRTSPRPG